MALIVKDRVLETCSTSGLVDFTLTGAVTGYQRFSAIGNGNTTYYAAYVIGSNDWEVGIGTVGTSSLTRDTILSSSTGSKVNFAGNPVVWCDLPSSKALFTDSNNNATANSFLGGFTSVTASGTQIVLTAASTPDYVVTGSGGQTIKLPDATTLANGYVFSFDNNQSSGAITVNNNSNTLVVSVPSGGYVYLRLLSNATAAGSWDRHDLAPSNVSWSTNTFDYPGSITSATWNGSTVAYNRGGTGQSSAFVAGGVVYGSSTTALAVTAIGTTGQVLLSNGASAPTWGNITQGVVWQSVQTANFTAVAGNAYPVNTTSSSIFVTLPISPTVGQLITVVDYAGTASTNNIVIVPNGNKIQGNTGNFALSINRQSVNLVYVDSTQGWVSYANQNSALVQSSYSASILVVAGGGGGAGNSNDTRYARTTGGGGAGGVLTNSGFALTNGVTYAVTVGAGGAGGAGQATNLFGTQGSVGGNSSFTASYVANGGGGGGTYNAINGGNGGSGGGQGNFSGTFGTSNQSSYSGWTAYGNSGGSGNNTTGFEAAGGGGGAGAVGVNSSGNGIGGAGGIGIVSSLITTTQATLYSVGQVVATSVYFAGGGGGGSYGNTSLGGSGGGGSGTGASNGGNGSANSGGGGGGCGHLNNLVNGTYNGGNGGGGVVLLSVPSAFYTGITTGSPTVVTNGSNTVMIFTTSGSYTA
jgi:hypothetical protein